jgi:hypothetical protein
MKNILSIFLLGITFNSLGQSILSNNNRSVLLTPEGIEIQPVQNYNSTNTALGRDALKLTIGLNNTAIGNYALAKNTQGNSNTAIGSFAGFGNKTGADNTYIGDNAGILNVGSRNTIIGSKALFMATNATGITAVGFEALKNNQGDYNTAIGKGALKENTTGTKNTALGYDALASGFDEENSSNTAIGYRALFKNEIGQSNTAIGSDAQFSNKNGYFNVSLGNQSLFLNQGDGNVAIGYKSLFFQSDTHGSLAIGTGAGLYNTENDMLYIENFIQTEEFATKPLIGGNFNPGTGEVSERKIGINRNISALLTRQETLQVEGEAFKTSGGGNWVTTSDRRLKKEIAPLNSAEILQKVLSLQGVNYEWKDEAKGKGVQYGFIAQDLQKVFPTKVQEDKNGYLSASYGDFDPMLVEAIKALYEELSSVKAELTEIRNFVNKTNPLFLQKDKRFMLVNR